MSTLKTHNLQSPDAGSVNIAMAPNAGMVVAGLSTYSNQINVGSNIKLGTAGVVTATSFVGSGANLTGMLSLSNGADNRVVTASSASALNGEANFSYDGTRCLIGTNTAAPYVNRNLTVAQGSSGNTTVAIEVRSPTNGDGRIIFTDSTSAGAGAYKGQIRYDQTNDFMSFNTNGDNERFRIDSAGRVMIGDTDTDNAFSGGDDLVIGNTSSRSGMTIVSSSSNDGGIYFSKGTSTDSVRGQIVYQHDGNGGYMRLYTNANERLRIAANGIITQSGKTAAAANPAIDPYTSFLLNDSEARLQLCATNSGSNAAAIILSNESKHFVIHQRGPVQSNNFEIAYQDIASPTDMCATATPYFRINTSGQVTKPSQASFAAYRNQSDWNVNNNYMVFNTTRHNVGGHYSTSNGRFTAPVAGSYYISFWSIYKNNYTNAAVRMYVNGSRIYGGDIHWTRDDLGSNWDHISYSQVVYMNANDYIQILSASNVTWHGNHWQCYSGYLLG